MEAEIQLVNSCIVPLIIAITSICQLNVSRWSPVAQNRTTGEKMLRKRHPRMRPSMQSANYTRATTGQNTTEQSTTNYGVHKNWGQRHNLHLIRWSNGEATQHEWTKSGSEMGLVGFSAGLAFMLLLFDVVIYFYFGRLVWWAVVSVFFGAWT